MKTRTLEELLEEIAALAAHVERLEQLVDDVLRHCPNWPDSPQSVFIERLAELRSDGPSTTTSLARLKAQWQIELLDKIRDYVDETSIWPCELSDIEDAINHQAKEPPE